jgi:3-oxoadipate enol-lactonase
MNGPTNLHYDVAGPSGAPVVVLAGPIATSLGAWSEQVAALRNDYCVVRYDHRGHGLSPVPPGPYSLADLGSDVIALLDTLGIATASFCGLSLGAMTGMWVAAHAPDRIDKLMLSCAMPRVRPGLWTARVDLVRRSGTEAIVESTLDRWFTPEFREAQPSVVSRIADMVRLTPDSGFIACCQALSEMNLWPELSEIRSSTLVVAASDDRAMTPTDAESVAEAIRAGRGDASTAVINDATHMAHLAQPEAFNSLLIDHLAS